jgi:nitrite reductase/ring-hydroxylating ferredoxin subunit/uncharacterized membrane protein
MIGERVELALENSHLNETAMQLAQTLHEAVLDGGESTRQLADLLHGTWLGHPLHPILTDVVVGAWTIGAIFDYVAHFGNSRQAEIVADALTDVGNVAAVPTILSGLTDFSAIPQSAAGMGLAHAAANNIGFVLQLASARARREGDRERALTLSTVAMVVMTAGAYLGGHLSYAKKVGVKHTDDVEEPRGWAPALEANKLRSHEPRRIDVAGHPVLLYREGERLHAVGAVCPHAGGPLEQGHFANGCVQCPWHDSVFALHDGRVVHGPSTYPITHYDTRVRDGMIEVRVTSP